MEMYYGKPLQIINQSICRENSHLSPYTKEEKEKCTSSLEVLSIRLRKACEIIENSYNKQVGKMKGLFM